MQSAEGDFRKELLQTGGACETTLTETNVYHRFSRREIQRTLMELLNQLDGFEVLSKVKIIMATNR